jgi:hypothetical protein
LQSYGKTGVICSTIEAAAVQYHSGTTFHSLFRFGIDEEFRGSIRSNLGHDTPDVRRILAADFIIIDEISMLTLWQIQSVQKGGNPSQISADG